MYSREPLPDLQEVTIPLGRVTLRGILSAPARSIGLVLFIHDAGGSRWSHRYGYVAHLLQRGGCATLLCDLRVADGEGEVPGTKRRRVDLAALTERLVGATDWAGMHPSLRGLPIGYLAVGAGAAAALVAAARWPNRVAAVVSCAGRPHLARTFLSQVRAPTLLVVAGKDAGLITVNEQAKEQMRHARVCLVTVDGAGRRFNESGELESVADLACDWFARFLAPAPRSVVRCAGPAEPGRIGE